jgi:AcrR family transcriptional regulator
MPTEAPQHAPDVALEDSEDNPASSRRYRRLRPGPGLSRELVEAHQRSRLQRTVVELVAEDGFQALTVRGLAARARISSGAFYRHYRGTDDCFLSTYDLICRRAAERLIAAGSDERDPRRRLVLGFERLIEEMSAAPQVAAFALWAAPAAGPAFTTQLRISAMQVGVALEYCLRPAEAPSLPPLVLEGLVGGLARIARVRGPSIESDQISPLAVEAADWTMGFRGSLAQTATVNFTAVSPVSRSSQSGPGSPLHGGWAGAPGDHRGMILSAAFQIARSGYHELSVPRICREAGVPRREFTRHFMGLEDCFSSALELRAGRTMAASGRGRLASPWSGTAHRALELLCGTIDGDTDGARLLLLETSAAGTRGVESRDYLITQLARVLGDTAPADGKPSAVEAEASTAAAWAILRGRLTNQTERRRQLGHASRR